MRAWWNRLRAELEPALAGFFQTLLGKPVRVHFDTVAEGASEVKTAVSAEGLWVRLQEVRSQTLCWLLWTQEALGQLAQAMLGQSLEELEAGGSDLAAELTGQLWGALEPALRQAGLEMRWGAFEVISDKPSAQEPVDVGRLRLSTSDAEFGALFLLVPQRVLQVPSEAPHASPSGLAAAAVREEVPIRAAQFPELASERNGTPVANLEILADVHLEISVELGRRTMPLAEVLRLTKGSLIELDKLAGEPVDILVNGRKIAQGEVVVIDENFGVRIIGLVSPAQRLRNAS
ncbi:MAG: flagellar motor switch protein FliN [Bacteroidota bacterium]|nr:flagellar motor switch protein FliN [Bacteroidota bacterium]MDW8136917.1 flagellar motor switch protein FliN [Bacteroidota bacterium]